jgi:hypothetical protein
MASYSYRSLETTAKHNHWFWIDNKDLRSKRLQASMMRLFSLAETSNPAQTPVITVGAGS